MRRIPRFSLIALAVLLCSVGVSERIFAQAPSAVEFKHLTPRDGLSAQFVWSILQDRHGYIWIGTADGLDRFDGYAVTNYSHDPRDSTSVRAGGVVALLEDERGGFWVGTTDGLDRMDPETGRFSHIVLGPNPRPDSLPDLVTYGLHIGSEGRLWAGTADGLFVLEDPDGRRTTRYAHDPDDPSSLSHSNVRDIEESPDGTLWIGTYGGGLNRFDPTTETAVHYRHDPDVPSSLSSDEIWELHRDARGTLWIATRRGLCRMDEADETFDCLLPDPDDPSRLSDGDIQSIEEDDQGRLWLGTGLGGVNVFDPASGAITHYRHDPSDPSSLGQDDVHTVFRDRFGTYWFAHHDRGISWMSPNRVRFETRRLDPNAPELAAINNVTDFLDEGAGVIWATTEHGLLRIDSTAPSPEHFVPFPEGPSSGGPAFNPNLLTALVKDQWGRLWMGNTMGGLFVFDPESRTFETISVPETDGWIVPSFMDAEGDIWIGTTEAGLWRVEPETEAVTPYLPDPQNAESVANTGVLPFLDAAGNIWLEAFNEKDQTELAFQQYDRERDAFTNRPVPLPENVEFANVHMFPEQAGVFWISSSEGLYRADVRSGDVDLYSREELNIPVQLNAMQRDARGRLWFGAWTGEFGMLDPAARTVTQYFAEDGVDIRRHIFSRRGPSGEVTFNGFGGLMRFHPEEILQKTTHPEVHVTAVRASGTALPISAGEESLRLTHDQNTLAFDYVGLNYDDPIRNAYRYTLEGFDEGWNDVGTQRSALYPKLPPGEYTFHVQAANSAGVWNDVGDAVALAILPPWWRTVWAYLLYGLLFVGGVVAADRIQRRRLVAKERARTQERELQQAREIERAYRDLQSAQQQLIQQEKMASLGQLTAGIAHEIKNPLNFVTNFAGLSEELLSELQEALRAGDLDVANEITLDLVTNIVKIEEHGRRADSIVRSMMQHARGTSGDREEVNLHAFVEEYVNLAYHGKRASTPDFNVNIERDFSTDLGKIQLVPQEMGRVLLNLLGNAFDAVYEKSAKRNGEYEPRVKISARRANGKVEIRVADNGPGVPDSFRKKVFEPFFTTKPTGSGTGLGLSLSYEIVTQGHGGTLDIESEDEEGTAFVVRLPADPLAGGSHPPLVDSPSK